MMSGRRCSRGRVRVCATHPRRRIISVNPIGAGVERLGRGDSPLGVFLFPAVAGRDCSRNDRAARRESGAPCDQTGALRRVPRARVRSAGPRRQRLGERQHRRRQLHARRRLRIQHLRTMHLRRLGGAGRAARSCSPIGRPAATTSAKGEVPDASLLTIGVAVGGSASTRRARSRQICSQRPGRAREHSRRLRLVPADRPRGPSCWGRRRPRPEGASRSPTSTAAPSPAHSCSRSAATRSPARSPRPAAPGAAAPSRPGAIKASPRARCPSGAARIACKQGSSPAGLS